MPRRGYTDKFDRIFTLNQYLHERRTPVSRREIERRLECSRATALRTIEALRDHLGAPLVYDRDRNGYHYDARAWARYELPGLWFNDSELYALLVSERLLAGIQPGLLGMQVAPLRKRIRGRVPRARGDEPKSLPRRWNMIQCSPRTRG